MALPDFLVIGVPKAATTSVDRYLDQHPDLAMARKEPHYFLHYGAQKEYRGPGDDASTANDVTTMDAYEALFDGLEGKLLGETSPQLLADARVPDRVAETVPDARFIAILREPAARAYSNFLHMRRKQREPLESFEAALEKEEERLAGGWEPFWGYRQQSRYGRNVEPWLRRFDAGRFHVTTMDALRADPVRTMQAMYRFLGVDPDFRPDVAFHYNPGGLSRQGSLGHRLRGKRPLGGATRFILPRAVRSRLHGWLWRKRSTYPPMRPETALGLRREFLPEIETLERRFKLDLAAWKDPA